MTTFSVSTVTNDPHIISDRDLTRWLALVDSAVCRNQSDASNGSLLPHSRGSDAANKMHKALPTQNSHLTCPLVQSCTRHCLPYGPP